jgi:hypothetical protein
MALVEESMEAEEEEQEASGDNTWSEEEEDFLKGGAHARGLPSYHHRELVGRIIIIRLD